MNSMKKVHSASYVFEVVKWLFNEIPSSQLQSSDSFEWNTFVHYTKPQQSNCMDCGLYVLHYMDLISKRIAEGNPAPIESEVATWTTGGFNVAKVLAIFHGQSLRCPD
jgi:hypothetical protein